MKGKRWEGTAKGGNWRAVLTIAGWRLLTIWPNSDDCLGIYTILTCLNSASKSISYKKKQCKINRNVLEYQSCGILQYMGRHNTTFRDMMHFSIKASNTPGEEHWIPGKATPKVVSDPAGWNGVGLRTALYAVYIGDVPPNRVPRSCCGEKLCVRPSHQVLISSCSKKNFNMQATANKYWESGDWATNY